MMRFAIAAVRLVCAKGLLEGHRRCDTMVPFAGGGGVSRFDREKTEPPTRFWFGE